MERSVAAALIRFITVRVMFDSNINLVLPVSTVKDCVLPSHMWVGMIQFIFFIDCLTTLNVQSFSDTSVFFCSKLYFVSYRKELAFLKLKPSSKKKMWDISYCKEFSDNFILVFTKNGKPGQKFLFYYYPTVPPVAFCSATGAASSTPQSSSGIWVSINWQLLDTALYHPASTICCQLVNTVFYYTTPMRYRNDSTKHISFHLVLLPFY